MILPPQEIVFVVGARPNFIKVSPLIREAQKRDIKYSLLHTGQHYDYAMSEIFFDGMNIPNPDINLEKDKISSFESLGKTMDLFQHYITKKNPDLIIVIGDVDSTMGCSIATIRNQYKLAHIESGERSFDMSMPEEINRIITDRLSNYLFCSSEHAKENLKRESLNGIVVGNVMVDNLFYYNSKNTFIEKESYIILTLHRQSNIEKINLRNLLRTIQKISKRIKVIFPIHPHTESNIKKFGFDNYLEGIDVRDPMVYLEFIEYIKNAKFVMTDSGGMQVESSVLNVPCITLRENTEWSDTILFGTNLLSGIQEENILGHVNDLLSGIRKYYDFDNTWWDGNASKRIFDAIEDVG